MMALSRILLVVFGLVCSILRGDDTFLNNFKKSGIPAVRAKEYIAAVEVFAKYDQLYGMSYHSDRWFSDELDRTHFSSNFSKDEAFQKARQTMIQFHRDYGNENPVTDAANFVRARRYYEYIFRVPKGTALDLADLRARLAQGEGNFSDLGKVGFPIGGTADVWEVRGNQYRELSIRLQTRNSALRNLVAVMDRQGAIAFQDYPSVGTILERPDIEEAKAVGKDGDFVHKVATEMNSLAPEKPITDSQVQKALEKELRYIEQVQPGLAKREGWQGVLEIATYRVLLAQGLDVAYGSIGIRRRDGKWELPNLANKTANDAVFERARASRSVTIRSGFGNSHESTVALIREKFAASVQDALQTVLSRQQLRPGVTAEQVEAQAVGETASDLMIPIINSFDRSGELTYEVSPVSVAYGVLKSLALHRDQFFEPAPVPAVVPLTEPTGRAVSTGEIQVKGVGPTDPCAGKGGLWSRLAGGVMAFFGGAR